MNASLHILSRMPGGEKEIHKRTIKDQVADKLAYMIQTGLLQVGDELPSERELAATLEVSRESVRGAIGVLSTRGMVDVSQGSRTRVAGLGGMSFAESMGALAGLKNKSIEEVTEAREEVEKQILKLAATRIVKTDLKRLELLVEEQKHMNHDPVAFQISDREFHSVVYASCGNGLLSDFASDLYDYALDLRRLALQKEGTIAQSVADHEAIVRALSIADPLLAERAIVEHLEHIHATTVSQIVPRKKVRRA
jgi:DNA-binding FadR family transcriptional regulator